jgi:hypothetical protein
VRSKPPQFCVHEWQQLLCGSAIALSSGIQQARYMGHVTTLPVSFQKKQMNFAVPGI